MFAKKNASKMLILYRRAVKHAGIASQCSQSVIETENAARYHKIHNSRRSKCEIQQGRQYQHNTRMQHCSAPPPPNDFEV
jgi:hypothetical protein